MRPVATIYEAGDTPVRLAVTPLLWIGPTSAVALGSPHRVMGYERRVGSWVITLDPLRGGGEVVVFTRDEDLPDWCAIGAVVP